MKSNTAPRGEVAHLYPVPAPEWLDALPHAAAIGAMDGDTPVPLHGNARFELHCNGWKAIAGEIDKPRSIVAECRSVLLGTKAEASFVWEPGGFQSRVFEVAVKPLGADRVLLSLVDRTTLVRSEANLRRELLSDSLTGMANRAGFGASEEARLLNAGRALRILSRIVSSTPRSPLASLPPSPPPASARIA